MTVSILNYIESILWFSISMLLVLIACFNKEQAPYKKVMLVTSSFFLAFGVSDIIEAQTGAWWKPLELFFFKASCVAGFIGCFVWYHKLKREQT